MVPDIANHVPHLRITWNESKMGITAQEVSRSLRKAKPPIVIGHSFGGMIAEKLLGEDLATAAIGFVAGAWIEVDPIGWAPNRVE